MSDFLPNYVKWSVEDFLGKDVPESTMEFLRDHGLPEEIPYTTIEFGPSLNSDSHLVIGADYDFPILVGNSGDVSVDYEFGNCFFNSNVILLCGCIHAFQIMKQSDNPVLSVEQFRLFLCEKDPLCLEKRNSVWKIMLDDFRSMAL